MERQSQFEMLRLLLMLFILMLHSVAYIQLGDCDTGWSGSLIVSFVYCAVPVFLLLSGYFGIKFKFKKIANLYLQCFFYGLIGYVIHLYVDHNTIGKSLLIESVFSISNGWWFITNYFLLCLLSPLINAGIDKLNKKQFKWVLFLLTIVNLYFGWLWGIEHNKTGYELCNYIYLYIIGRYIGTYFRIERELKVTFLEKSMVVKGGVKLSKSMICIGAYVIFCLSMFFFDISFGRSYLIFDMHKYNYPIIILCSIALLMSFSHLKLNSKIVNYLSSSALAVYLIHGNHYINGWFVKWVQLVWEQSDVLLVKWMLIFCNAIVVLILCLLIDKIRIIIMRPLNPLINYLDDMIRHSYCKWN